MNIKRTPEIQGVERMASTPAEPPVPAKRDRVTVDGPPAAELVAAAGAKAAAARGARMKQLEGAIKAGQYHPSAAQLADQLLDAAEIDAKLRAMLRG